MRINRLSILSLLILAGWLACQAAPYVMRLRGDRGLSNNYVMGIAQDRNGFVWVATESGLNRFDGSSFRCFKTSDSGINANELNRIVADTVSNTLWICTQRHGLNALDCDTYSFTSYRAGDSGTGLSSDGITDAALAADGKLWITNYNSGLDLLDTATGQITRFNKKNTAGLTDDRFWTVATGNDGLVYLGHVDGGFSILDPASSSARNFRHIPGDASSLPGNSVRTIFPDSHNNIWVGTDRGLALFNRASGKFTTFRHNAVNPYSLISDHIYHIIQTSADELWISTENGGLSILDLRHTLPSNPEEVTFRNIYPSPGEGVFLSNKTLHSVFEDSFGNIWIGTYGDGIDILCHRELPMDHFHKGRPNNALSDNAVMSICVASDTVYVGTDEAGADIFIRGKFAGNINASNSPLGDNAVLAMMRASDGKIWLGTYGGTIATILPGGAIRRVNVPDCADVRCFAEKPDGTVLAGIGKGVVEIAPDMSVTTHYASEGKLREEWIRAIAVAPDGNLWVGSFGNGISIYTPDFKPLKTLDVWHSLKSNTIQQIALGPDGKIWAATGDGLALIAGDGTVEKIYGAEDGLTDPVIKSICFDPSGNLWMTTGAGISVLAKDGSVSNFDKGHDITTSDFNRASVGLSSDGRIFFGSHNGLYRLNPDVLAAKVKLHPPVITGITVFGRQGVEADQEIYVPSGTLRLNHNQNTLRVDFGILDISDAPAVTWSYNVEGIDKRWYPASPDDGILLRNLPPGDYRLAIKASVTNQTDDVVTILPFRIAPPVWATIWAKLLYLLIALAAIFFGLKFYKKRLELEASLEVERKNSVHQNELNAERLRFFTNITHELRTPLTLILGPLEDMKSDPGLSSSQTKKIGLIHKSASRLLELINTILEFRKTETQNRKLTVEHADLSALVSETGTRYRELNTNPSLEIATEIEPGDYNLWFDAETISIIIDNLMSNACKYTVSGNVTLRLRHTVESGVPFTEIAVSDTGLGMTSDTLPRIFDRYYRDNNSSNRLGTGIGLALVFNLVKLHQGEIFVESEPDRGSTFRFRIPTDNTYPEARRKSTAPASDDTPSPAATQETPADKPTVLVVDDNIDILSYIRGILDEIFNVVTATDGEDGLTKASEIIPDIILSDVMMPKMDGMDMIRRLKENPETSHIPVVVVTAKIAEEARLEAYNVGADSFITKPFSSKLLIARLNNILTLRHNLAVAAVRRQLETPEEPSGEYSPNPPADAPAAPSQDTPTEEQTPILSRMTEADEEFINKIGEIIRRDISGENLDVGAIATEMCMSHSTLYRKVKSITGMSVARLIRKYRAQKAAELLKTGRYTISEIAMMVGMGSLGNFRQCFREEFNTTPSEYLREISR